MDSLLTRELIHATELYHDEYGAEAIAAEVVEDHVTVMGCGTRRAVFSRFDPFSQDRLGAPVLHTLEYTGAIVATIESSRKSDNYRRVEAFQMDVGCALTRVECWPWSDSL